MSMIVKMNKTDLYTCMAEIDLKLNVVDKDSYFDTVVYDRLLKCHETYTDNFSDIIDKLSLSVSDTEVVKEGTYRRLIKTAYTSMLGMIQSLNRIRELIGV